MFQRLVLAAAVGALLSTGAAAQSSVTLYGRLNTTLERSKAPALDANGNPIFDPISEKFIERTSNDMRNNASRIGFKGVEDLGGGLKGLFLIEHGFDSDTGAQSQSRFWARESWVGLGGGFGRLRLGNMGATAAYYATADYVSLHNHDTGTSADAFYFYLGDPTNTISYNTPDIGGLVVEAQFGLKEAGQRHTVVLAANYDRGPIHLGAAYAKGPPDAYGADLASSFGGENTRASQLGLRALVDIGPFTLGGYYLRDELKFAVPGQPDDGIDRDSYRVSLMYTTGALELHGNLGIARELKGSSGGTLEDSRASQATLGANYNLSKRTKVYGFFTKLENKRSADYFTGVVGSDFTSLGLGVRHNF
jgi:predicted porin